MVQTDDARTNAGDDDLARPDRRRRPDTGLAHAVDRRAVAQEGETAIGRTASGGDPDD